MKHAWLYEILQEYRLHLPTRTPSKDWKAFQVPSLNKIQQNSMPSSRFHGVLFTVQYLQAIHVQVRVVDSYQNKPPSGINHTNKSRESKIKIPVMISWNVLIWFGHMCTTSQDAVHYRCSFGEKFITYHAGLFERMTGNALISLEMENCLIKRPPLHYNPITWPLHNNTILPQ